jgi:glycosyltransferase involved in cell wall biosynthesis
VSQSASNVGADSPFGKNPKRIDLHCHSDASNEADEAVLNALECPESFSAPPDVYRQAKRNGMDFVTITDHDCISGVTRLRSTDILIGEEVTCYFPEDRCKIHLLVWGLTAEDHDALQGAANDIYELAQIVERRRLAHSVAHPVYRQNDRLERWHLERLMLMFKGFETLNGAHSALHRRAVEELLSELSERKIAELSAAHGLAARWPQPHIKARTGGSDDHGLFNIGRTWTEFPCQVKDVADVLACLRQGLCRPGGEAGSSLKLAHNFFGVGIRYHQRKAKKRAATAEDVTTHGILLEKLLGERRTFRRRDWVKFVVKEKLGDLRRMLARPLGLSTPPKGAALLTELFDNSCRRRLEQNPAIAEAVRSGQAALSQHEEMFRLVSAINRDISGGIAEALKKAMNRGEMIGMFDSLSAVAAQQFLMLPYYFAMFHQNRERVVLPRLVGRRREVSAEGLRLGVFTDTFDEINGVGRFILDMSRHAAQRGRSLVVHTSTDHPRVDCPSRKNFAPLVSYPTPFYADQPVALPPLAEIMQWADQQQFDAIHVHTPGPMGLCGWLVGQMLRIPVLGTYHTDFPRYVHDLIGDHRLTTVTTSYMKWFYGQTETVFARSRDYRSRLRELGFADEKLAMSPPGVDTEKFCPEKRDPSVWMKLGVTETHKLLYAGRVSVEKNLPFLVDAFARVCHKRSDTALIIAGDGPYRATMEKATAGLPVYFLGFQKDQELAQLYASSDLFVFPSKTDTLGQVVVEAQASGLPVLVSDQGGPKEFMDDQLTGHILATDSAAVWSEAIDSLLTDTIRRQRMSRTAPTRTARFSAANTFETFWNEHVKAAVRAEQFAAETPAKVPGAARGAEVSVG